MLNVGDNAPEFNVPDQSGNPVILSGLRGKAVVLFFYPKADTPGCTVEACAFRDSQTDFETENAVLLGISGDSSDAQAKFADKFGFEYPLLADTEHTVAEAYGVWVEKSMYGKTYMGIDRTTFVIDPDGKLTHIFRKVKPEGHADEVLAAIREAGGGDAGK